MQAYAIKAAREGKHETSWLDPNEAYESGLDALRRRHPRPRAGRRTSSQRSRPSRAAPRCSARSTASSQLALKATMPGVPDFYQGTEFWDLSLVDPDNRRPVDFDARAAALAALDGDRTGAALADQLAGRPHQACADAPAAGAAPDSRPCSATAPTCRSRSRAASRPCGGLRASPGRDAVIVAVGRQWGRLHRFRPPLAGARRPQRRASARRFSGAERCAAARPLAIARCDPTGDPIWPASGCRAAGAGRARCPNQAAIAPVAHTAGIGARLSVRPARNRMLAHSVEAAVA